MRWSGLLGGELGYRLLRSLWVRRATRLDGSAYIGKSKLRVLLGPAIYEELRGKVIVDFGCGEGIEAVELACHGVTRVIGIDMQEPLLAEARKRAREAGVGERCQFVTASNEKCDVVISLDSFEHFTDPQSVLEIMRGLLKPEGYVWTSFGPTWCHPYGGHGFSPFPWAHLIFSEGALTRRMRDLSPRQRNIHHFHEYWEGLGQMTIARFERCVEQAGWEFISLKAVPIRRLHPLHNRLTREFTTSVVQAKIRPTGRSALARPVAA